MPLDASSQFTNSTLFSIIVDLRLAIVVQDLKHLVDLINGHLDRGSLLSGLLFQDSLGSIQARLVQLQHHLKDTSDECLRLGMLAFISTTLRIPGAKFPYKYLAEKLRSACQTFALETPTDEHLLFWLLMVGSISVFEADEPWSLPLWLRLGASRLSWEDAQSRLQTTMWIDKLQGTLAQAALTKLSHNIDRNR